MHADCSKAPLSDGTTSLNPLQEPRISHHEDLFQKKIPTEAGVNESFVMIYWHRVCLMLHSFFFVGSKKFKKLSIRLLILYGIAALLTLVLAIASTTTSSYLANAEYVSCNTIRLAQEKIVSQFLTTHVRSNTNKLDYSLSELYGAISGSMPMGESDVVEKRNIFHFVSEKLVNRYKNTKINLFCSVSETIVKVHPTDDEWLVGRNPFRLLNISEITPFFAPSSQTAVSRFSTSLSILGHWTLSKVQAMYNGTEVGKSPLWGVVGTFSDIETLSYKGIFRKADSQNVDFAVILEIEDEVYYLINTSVEELRAFPTQENIKKFVEEGYSTVVDDGQKTLFLVTRNKSTCAMHSRLTLIFVGEILLCVLLFIFSLVMIRCSFHTYNAFKCAPKAPPFAFLKIGPKYSQELWDLAPDEMRQLANMWSHVLEGITTQFHAYPLPQHQPFVTSFVLHSVSDAVLMASQVFKEVSGQSKRSRKGLQYHRMNKKLIELLPQNREFEVICLIHWCTEAIVSTVEVEETITYQGADIHLGTRLWPAAPGQCVVLSEEAKDRLVIDEENPCLLEHACGVCAQGFTRSRSLFVFVSPMDTVCKTFKRKGNRKRWKRTPSCSGSPLSPVEADSKGASNPPPLDRNENAGGIHFSRTSSLPFENSVDLCSSSFSSKDRLSSLHSDKQFCANDIFEGKEILFSPTNPSYPSFRLNPPHKILRRLASKKRTRDSNGKRLVAVRVIREKSIGCFSRQNSLPDGDVTTVLPSSGYFTSSASPFLPEDDRRDGGPIRSLSIHGSTVAHPPSLVDATAHTSRGSVKNNPSPKRTSPATGRDPLGASDSAKERRKRRREGSPSRLALERLSPSLLSVCREEVEWRTFQRKRRARNTIDGHTVVVSSVEQRACTTSCLQASQHEKCFSPFLLLHSSVASIVESGDATPPENSFPGAKTILTNRSFRSGSRVERRKGVDRTHPRRQNGRKLAVGRTGSVCTVGNHTTEAIVPNGGTNPFFFAPIFSPSVAANRAGGVTGVRPSRMTHSFQKDDMRSSSNFSLGSVSSDFLSLSPKQCEREWRRTLDHTDISPTFPIHTLSSDASWSPTHDHDKQNMKIKTVEAAKPEGVMLLAITGKPDEANVDGTQHELKECRATPSSQTASLPVDLQGGLTSSFSLSSASLTVFALREKDSLPVIGNPLSFTNERTQPQVMSGIITLPVVSFSSPENSRIGDGHFSFSGLERKEGGKSSAFSSSEKKSSDVALSSLPRTLSEIVSQRTEHQPPNEEGDSVVTHPIFSALQSDVFSSPSISSSSSSVRRNFFTTHGVHSCKRKHFLSKAVDGGGGVVDVPSGWRVPVCGSSSSSLSTQIRPLPLHFSSLSEHSVRSLAPPWSLSSAEHPPPSGSFSTGELLGQYTIPLSRSSLRSPSSSSFSQEFRSRSSRCSTNIGPRKARERSKLSLLFLSKKYRQRPYSTHLVYTSSSEGPTPSQADDPCLWVPKSRSSWWHPRSTCETRSNPLSQSIGRKREWYFYTHSEEKENHEDGGYRTDPFYQIPFVPCSVFFLASSVSSPLHVASTLSSYTKQSLRRAFESHRLSTTVSFDQVFPLIAMFYIARELLFRPLSLAEKENITRCVATVFGVPVEGATDYIAVHCTFRYIFQKKEMIETL